MNRRQQIAVRLRDMENLLESQILMTPPGNLLLPGYLADMAALPGLIREYEEGPGPAPLAVNHDFERM